jgi:hypothetical protein
MRRSIEETKKRSFYEPEYELLDVPGILNGGYFDIRVRYAKGSPNDTLIELRIRNESSRQSALHVVPSLWFRNTWGWGRTGEPYYYPEPKMWQVDASTVIADHSSVGRFRFSFDSAQVPGSFLWTRNETNFERLYDQKSPVPYVKDAFHRYIVDDEEDVLSPKTEGTKLGVHSVVSIEPHQEVVLHYRLSREDELPEQTFGNEFHNTFVSREKECDEFYRQLIPSTISSEQKMIAEQAYSGLLWSKQFSISTRYISG